MYSIKKNCQVVYSSIVGTVHPSQKKKQQILETLSYIIVMTILEPIDIIIY